jgi:hypothetical protein
MSLDSWRQFEVLSQAARNLDPSQQRAFLAAACDGDEDLLREVERSLSLSDAASTVAPLNGCDWLSTRLLLRPVRRAHSRVRSQNPIHAPNQQLGG